MRRYDPRLIIGGLLIFGGILALLDELGIISNGDGIFWGVVFGAGGLVFLYMLVKDRATWWPAFPAFALLSLAIVSLTPNWLDAFDGLIFLAGISCAFWWIYFNNMVTQWWAIIPGGVLLTLGVVSAAEDGLGVNETGALFFLGLGLTFFLVAILPGGKGRSWALIPGSILLVSGTLLGLSGSSMADYILPAVMIFLGGYFLLRFFIDRPAG